ncbi:AAA family ATPase [Flavobacterium sp. Arc3]|uniref:AAA family ATPase n=1 Tax=Flavobacterium sp. Arc3 TaxID=3046686 RepID=UPI00352DF8E7
MSIFNIKNIPSQLLFPSNSDEDINILIGENGSGKSTLLNDISKFHLSQNSKVIAIANTIYDKFNSRNSRFKILRSSTGKTLARNTIVNAFKILAKDDLKRLRNVANTLVYIGFDPVISLKIKGVNPEFREKLIDSELTSEEKEHLLYYLNRYIDRAFHKENIVDINFTNEKFEDLKNSYLLTMFLYEKQLKSLKLISGINIYLHKNNQHIPLNKASSGELTLVTSLIYLTSVITENCVILIDEPENSLHPKWQIEYITRLNELFYFYQPKIIVATHSPLIINGAEINIQNIKIFKGANGNFILEENEKINVEEIYQEYFDVTTPENRYLSENLIDKMNLLASKDIGLDKFTEEIKNIQDNSYDDKQIKLLDEVLVMGRKIINDLE